MINIFQPSLGNEEIEILEDVFASNWIGMGSYVENFKKEFAKSLNKPAKHFVTTTSCSEGIFLAPYIFGFEAGDEIVAPSISFVAVGSSIKSSKCKMVLCDVDRTSCNATAELIERKINKNTKAVILNHYGGYPCDMDPIMDLCKTNGLILVEDSACAVKAFYKGRACGTFGDMGLWSFGPTKIICTGDGGMIYLRSEELISTAKERLYHGLSSRDKSGFDKSSSENNAWWEIQINRIGKRAIMNDISGALGVAQMGKLDIFLKRRKEIYELYLNELSDLHWLKLPPKVQEGCAASYYFFFVQLTRRDELSKYLLENGIYSTFRYWPLHRIKYFKYGETDLVNSDYICEHTLNLPLHQSITDEQMEKIIRVLKEFGKLNY